jgi:archaellum component FlaC
MFLNVCKYNKKGEGKMDQKEINKIANSVKKGIKTAYDEISKSITIFSEKANKGAKEIALKLELPRAEKKKSLALEKIGKLIYETKGVEIKEPTAEKKLKTLMGNVKAIETEISEMSSEIDTLSSQILGRKAARKKPAAKKAAAKKPAAKKPAAKKPAAKKPAAKKPAAKKPAAKKPAAKKPAAKE